MAQIITLLGSQSYNYGTPWASEAGAFALTHDTFGAYYDDLLWCECSMYNTVFRKIARPSIAWDTSSLSGKVVIAAYIEFLSDGGVFDEPDTLILVPGTGTNSSADDYATLHNMGTVLGMITSAVYPSAGNKFHFDLDATGISFINTSGVTRFGLRTNSDINSLDPGLNVRRYFGMANSNTVSDYPRLIVTVESSYNNQIVTGLRHIYNRKRDDLEITFGGYSTAEDLIAPDVMKTVEEATIPQIPTKSAPKFDGYVTPSYTPAPSIPKIPKP
jgi:hypothetical protein